MNHGDAVLQGLPRRAQVHRTAVQAQLAGIRGIDSSDDLHEGRLAGTVFADESVHRTALDPKGYVIQGHDSGERLADVADFKEAASRRVGGQAHGRSVPAQVIGQIFGRHQLERHPHEACHALTPDELQRSVDGSGALSRGVSEIRSP